MCIFFLIFFLLLDHFWDVRNYTNHILYGLGLNLYMFKLAILIFNFYMIFFISGIPPITTIIVGIE